MNETQPSNRRERLTLRAQSQEAEDSTQVIARTARLWGEAWSLGAGTTMDSAQETSPLLVDPPIDDESYRREARTFPSDEQKHLMFVSYTLTTTVSRMVEILSTLLMAFTYSSSLIPITAFSFFVLASSSHTQQIAFSEGRLFKSRVRLLAASILQQRLSNFALPCLIMLKDRSDHWAYQLVIFLSLTFSIIVLKNSFFLYQSTFRRDWLQILCNGKDSVRIRFETTTHAVSVILQLSLPIASGVLLASVNIKDCCKILAFTSILSLMIETSLMLKLFSTCYALHLPRPSMSLEVIGERNSYGYGALDPHPMIGVLTTPVDTLWLSSRYIKAQSRPILRVYNYVKRKPIPVIVTCGVILINISLITMGPHMVWYLLRKRMNPAIIGVFKMLQTLVTLHPAMSAPRAFNVLTLGAFTAAVCVGILTFRPQSLEVVWTYLFALSVVIARSGVPTINLVGDQFVEQYLADEEVHRVYKENAVWLRTQSELVVHVLTLIFPSVGKFIYPIAISALFTLLGRVLILRTIKRHWRQEQ